MEFWESEFVSSPGQKDVSFAGLRAQILDNCCVLFRSSPKKLRIVIMDAGSDNFEALVIQNAEDGPLKTLLRSGNNSSPSTPESALRGLLRRTSKDLRLMLSLESHELGYENHTNDTSESTSSYGMMTPPSTDLSAEDLAVQRPESAQNGSNPPEDHEYFERAIEYRAYAKDLLNLNDVDQAWVKLNEADKTGDLDYFNIAFFNYARLCPELTLPQMQTRFSESGFGTSMIAIDTTLSGIYTNVDLQGRTNCRYLAFFDNTGGRPAEWLDHDWPRTAEENLNRIEDAGFPVLSLPFNHAIESHDNDKPDSFGEDQKNPGETERETKDDSTVFSEVRNHKHEGGVCKTCGTTAAISGSAGGDHVQVDTETHQEVIDEDERLAPNQRGSAPRPASGETEGKKDVTQDEKVKALGRIFRRDKRLGRTEDLRARLAAINTIYPPETRRVDEANRGTTFQSNCAFDVSRPPVIVRRVVRREPVSPAKGGSVEDKTGGSTG